MITVLHRGGSSEMITVLHRGGPANDYGNTYPGNIVQQCAIVRPHQKWSFSNIFEKSP